MNRLIKKIFTVIIFSMMIIGILLLFSAAIMIVSNIHLPFHPFICCTCIIAGICFTAPAITTVFLNIYKKIRKKQ